MNDNGALRIFRITWSWALPSWLAREVRILEVPHRSRDLALQRVRDWALIEEIDGHKVIIRDEDILAVTEHDAPPETEEGKVRVLVCRVVEMDPGRLFGQLP